MGWDCKIVDPQEIKYLHPLIKTEGLVGGIYSLTDGSVDPTGN
jgi:glycine/D-amino acid oxidase-like deaminating enzyme